MVTGIHIQIECKRSAFTSNRGDILKARDLARSNGNQFLLILLDKPFEPATEYWLKDNNIRWMTVEQFQQIQNANELIQTGQ